MMRDLSGFFGLSFSVLAIGASLSSLFMAGCGRHAYAVEDVQEAIETKKTSLQNDSTGTQPAWYSVQLHAHSQYSDGVHDVRTLIDMAKAAGLDALAITDHYTTEHWKDPSFVNEKELLVIRSEEGGERHDNHLGLHGMTGWNAIPEADREDVLAQAQARNATVILNHPFSQFIPWKPLVMDSRIHAIEVWNGYFWTPIQLDDVGEGDGDFKKGSMWQPNENAVRWWSWLLAQGHRVAAIATSDFHRAGKKIELPCTFVYASSRTEAGILEGIRKGRTILATTPQSERVELEADNNHDGRFESMVGDEVFRSATFKAKVSRGLGKVLVIYQGQREIFRKVVPSDDYQVEFKLSEPKLGQKDFVYARLNQQSWPLTIMKSMTSAIYIRE